jgi:hypothetical protein
MCPLPVDPNARKRLQDAQRAEAEALKAVELATRARDRVQRKLDTANAELDAAKSTLIEGSGISRAALLLAEDESDLRRIRRLASLTPKPPTREATINGG